MIRAAVRPELLSWARIRSGLPDYVLRKRFPHLAEWEAGTRQPTFKQLEAFAGATYAPVGYLFLREPPSETLPLPDFRTFAGGAVPRPSPALLDTIYICQQRQDWYRDFARENGELAVSFVGSVSLDRGVESAAAQMRRAIGFDLEARRNFPTWAEALRHFIGQADDLGVLVMCSGVVFNNNRRALDPEEFRGFAIADPLAPLIFINGADTKAGQMFTLAHELAHLWLGATGVSDSSPMPHKESAVESWCNRVAAEFLVPLAVFREELRRETGSAPDAVSRLARRFKVSTLVILRRLLDAGTLSFPEFQDAYALELVRLLSITRSSGGDFYLTHAARVSKRLARALVVSTLEGQTLYSEAFRLLGISKVDTFTKMRERLAV